MVRKGFCGIWRRTYREDWITYDLREQKKEKHGKNKENTGDLQKRLCQHFRIGFEIGDHGYPFMTIARKA